MRRILNRNLALFLAAVLLVPIFWSQSVSEAGAAATQELTKTKLELAGIGEKYDLNIKNKVAKSKYAWTTLNKAIATVASNGLVTAVGKGTTTVRCKITFPTKKTKTLSCSVTVKLPADGISITNAPLENGAYRLTLGSTYDFDTALTPEGTTDTTFWYVDSGDKDCIRIDDAQAGKITAMKAGKASLRVRACNEASKESAAKSDIDAAVIIEVTAPTATVKSAEITDSNQITVVFDSPVQQSTVIGSNNKLTDNIIITPLMNTKKVMSGDPGALTPSLSSDLKTLTITSANMLQGEYKISISGGVKTSSGVAVEDYIKNMSFVDVVPPYITGVTLDDSGVILYINFNEPIDFTNFKVSNAQLATPGGEPANSLTLSILNNTANYIISTDKKSLKVDLSNIVPSDFGRAFSVILSGIKDYSGNVPTSAYLIANLYTDKSLKPQAQLINIERTSYYILTATFDRAIQSGGILQISGGSMAYGVVDPTNNKKVDYKITDYDASLTGIRNVSLSSWKGYNVISTDYTGLTPVTRSVNFDVDRTVPMLTGYEYDSSTGILTMTYNEEVNLTIAAGSFTARLVTASQIVKDGYNISYTNVAHTDGKNIIKLRLTNMADVGYYTFSINQGFVTDNFKNLSGASTATVNNSNGGTELPGPFMVTQSLTNPSQITLEFANMLDLASAQNVNNYSITGVTLTSAVVMNNSSTGATVVLNVLDGTIDVSVERQLKISGVMGYNASYSAITSYSRFIVLKDNKKPAMVGDPVFDTSTRNAVKLNFSEAVQGTLIVNVTQASNTSPSLPISSTVTITGSVVRIVLNTVPPNGCWLRIDIVSNNLTDLSGNPVTFLINTMGTGVYY